MKKLPILFFTLFHFFCFSQEKSTITEIKVITEHSEDKNLEVPFAIVEDVPVFPGCEEVARNKKNECFQEKLNEHIIKNLKYPKQASKKNTQGRVSVLFVINSEGNIEGITTKAPAGCELLEEEAVRIMSLLPKMEPGKFRGKPVNVKYAQPIIFNLK